MDPVKCEALFTFIPLFLGLSAHSRSFDPLFRHSMLIKHTMQFALSMMSIQEAPFTCKQLKHSVGSASFVPLVVAQNVEQQVVQLFVHPRHEMNRVPINVVSFSKVPNSVVFFHGRRRVSILKRFEFLCQVGKV